jgi:hypothetical protein
MKTSCGFAAALLLVCAASPAAALLPPRTWVSGVGDDANPCSRTAPCKTLSGAFAKTEVGGEISVLDPGGFAGVTITKSITINGTPSGSASNVLGAGASGFAVNITDPADTRRTVRFNGVDINGWGQGVNGIRILGTNLPGVSVVIENTSIDGLTGRGISDERTNGGKLVISNTTVRHTQDSAIRIAAGGVNKIDAVLSNVRVHNSGTALTANGGAKVTVSDSVFSGSGFGLDIEQANTEAVVDRSTVSGNTTGIFTTGGAMLRLSNSTVSFNATGVNGTVNSFTNNQFVGNGPGGAIVAVGAPTSPTGQQ